MKAYDGLAISSGGFKGLGILGYLLSENFNGTLSTCKKFAGCSVGGAINLLIAVGWKPYELFFRVIDIKLFNSIQEFDVNNFQHKHGLLDISSLREELEVLVVEKRVKSLIKLPTLLDLHNEGIYIAFSTTDRISRKNIKLDYKSAPHMKATEACLASASIPFIYEPMSYEGMLLSDGALTNPFPIDYIDDGKTKILGISVFGSKDASTEGLLEHVTNTFMIPVEELQRIRGGYISPMANLVEMIITDFSYFDTSNLTTLKVKMFLKGVSDSVVMNKLLEQKRKILKARERRDHYNRPVYTQTNVSQSVQVKKYLEIPEDVIMSCLRSQPLRVLAEVSQHEPRRILELYGRLPKRDAQLIYEFITLLSPPPPKAPVKETLEPQEPKPMKVKEVKKDKARNKHYKSPPGSSVVENLGRVSIQKPGAEIVNEILLSATSKMSPETKIATANVLESIGEEQIKKGVQIIGNFLDMFRVGTLLLTNSPGFIPGLAIRNNRDFDEGPRIEEIPDDE